MTRLLHCVCVCLMSVQHSMVFDHSCVCVCVCVCCVVLCCVVLCCVVLCCVVLCCVWWGCGWASVPCKETQPPKSSSPGTEALSSACLSWAPGGFSLLSHTHKHSLCILLVQTVNYPYKDTWEYYILKEYHTSTSAVVLNVSVVVEERPPPNDCKALWVYSNTQKTLYKCIIHSFIIHSFIIHSFKKMGLWFSCRSPISVILLLYSTTIQNLASKTFLILSFAKEVFSKEEKA